jgi:hypothetical protein
VPSPRASERSRRGWTPQHIAVLRSGVDYHCAFTYAEPSKISVRPREGWDVGGMAESRLRQAAADIGDELLAEWIAARPSTRPWFWWRFQSPEPRLRISGERSQWDHSNPAKYPVGFTFGVPLVSSFGFEANHEIGFEPQYDYLARHGLLTPEEMEAVNAISA